MPPEKAPVLALAVAGLLLLANPLWLFPHEGDVWYTYERSKLSIEGGTISYEGKGHPSFGEENSLNAIGCQRYDDEQPRACALDRHLVNHSPVTVPGDRRAGVHPEFVRLDGAYYRRVYRRNGTGPNTTATHDVKRVPPEVVLREAAVNLSGASASGASDLRLSVRIAVTGDTVRTVMDLEEADLGRLYLRDGDYYTVVVTDRQPVDHGPSFLRYELPRYLISAAGILLLAGSVKRLWTGS